MARKSSDFVLGLVFMSIVLVLFTRRPSGLPDQVVRPIGVTITTVTTDQSNELEEPNQIRQISVLGERNSGTRWTFE